MKIPCIDKRSPLQSHKCMQLDKIDCPSKTDLICCQRNWKLKFIDSKLNRNQLFVVEIQGVRHFRVNIPRADSGVRERWKSQYPKWKVKWSKMKGWDPPTLIYNLYIFQDEAFFKYTFFKVLSNYDQSTFFKGGPQKLSNGKIFFALSWKR